MLEQRDQSEREFGLDPQMMLAEAERAEQVRVLVAVAVRCFRSRCWTPLELPMDWLPVYPCAARQALKEE